jgi:hypothetical protein
VSLELIIFTRPIEPDEQRLLDVSKEATALLLGRAVLSAAAPLAERTVWVLAEEVMEMGLQEVLPPAFVRKAASEVIEQMITAKLLNL